MRLGPHDRRVDVRAALRHLQPAQVSHPLENDGALEASLRLHRAGHGHVALLQRADVHQLATPLDGERLVRQD